MIKLNNLSKWIIAILLSFGAGALFLYLVQSPKPIRIIEKTVRQPMLPKSEQAIDLSDNARKKYQELMAEYTEYVGSGVHNDISFKEFMSIKKGKLVQNKKYTTEDIQTDEEIKRWFNSYTNVKNTKRIETNKYSINGTIISPYKNRHSCYISVSIYSQPLEEMTPKEAPLATVLLDDCRGGSFSLDFLLSNFEDQETPPTYIAAFAFDVASSLYLWPLAYGTDNKINGIPPSLLASRKNNDPIKIQLKEINTQRLDNITLSIKSEPNLWTTIYGVDSISRLAPELGIYKTGISDNDGIARLTGVPMVSNIYTQIFDPNKDRKLNMIIPTFVGKIDLEIPKIIFSDKTHYSNPSLVIFPPNNIDSGEFVLSSKRSLKNKSVLEFDNSTKEPLIVDDLDVEGSLLELKYNNTSLGLMPIKLKKNETLIVNPIPKKIEKLAGTISYIKGSFSQDSFCNDCKIELKYTEKNTNTDSHGKFVIKNIALIDDQLEVLLEVREQRFIIPLIVHNDIKNIELNLEIPDNKLITLWNKTIPTLPINGIVYGSYPYHKSYRAFLKSIDGNIIYESKYFDDTTGLPSRTKYSTSLFNNKVGFSKFIFPDVTAGEYILYIVAGSDIVHSRLVNVEQGITTIIY